MKKALILTMAVSLPACSVQKPQTQDQFVASAVSAIGGAAIGYSVGAELGSGTGNILMMIFGGTLGAMGGWAYGGTLMPSDREAFRENAQNAMQHASNGQVVPWANPQTRTAGAITPTSNFVGKGGKLCRNFDATISAKDGIGRGSGVACKDDNGDWVVYGLTDSNV
jgi:surface antigen